MNKQISIETDETRVRPDNSEVERLWADNTKANQLFGWTPKYKGIEGFKDGLKQTIEWFVEPSNLLNYKSDIYNL